MPRIAVTSDLHYDSSGSLTTGRFVAAEEKVRAVVSGHTHIGREGTLEREGMPPLDYRVVAGDYGKPAYTIVEV